jgi:plasmid replication initiation protein
MEYLIVKDNALINASYSLSLVEQRLILLAIVAARESSVSVTSNKKLTVSASTYSTHFESTKQAAYMALKDACNNLFERRFSFEERNGKVKQVKSRWVQRIAYIEDHAEVEIKFSDDVIPYITELEKRFTQYELKQISCLNSAYAVRLYELLIAWRSTGKVSEISINELKTRLGLLNDEYKVTADFKKRVLDLAINQINQHTDIKASYEQHKNGRTITGFSFSFTFKKTQNPKPAPTKPKPAANKQREDAREKAAAAAHLKMLAELAGEPIENLLKRP